MSILEMRNEPQVRSACHDTSIIIYNTHREYMKKLDSNPDAHQWVICYGDEVIGHVKIIAGELGYMLKKGFRGKGLGIKFHELSICRSQNTWNKKTERYYKGK